MCTHVGSGRDIQVGNPVAESSAAILQVATIGEVDWNHLEPGDTVRIFHRAEPYREKILVRGKGTETQPIRVCGVPSATGELPHVTGESATTRPDLDYGDLSNLMEDLAVLAIYHRSYEQRPENIVVEGLKLSGTLGDPGTPAAVLSYTATNGTVRKYRSAAACLRIQEGKNVTIRGNELTGCGNGLFVLSRIPESQMTRNILIEGNVLHGNGVVGEEGIHNAYVQGVDITLQLNVFGPNRAGASGNALKLRVAGDVVRYNAFENGARILDLVEVEDHAEFVFPDKYAAFKAAYPTEIVPGDDERVAAAWKAYQRSYVYGNLIRNVGTGACTNVVHYSFDNVQNDRRPGTLYFYNNTIVNRTDFSKKAIVRLLDQGPWWGNSGPAVTNNTFDGYANVEAFNNVFVLESSTPGATRSYFEMTRYRADKLTLGVNWWSSGWDAAIPGYNQAFPGLGNALVDNPAYVYPGGNDTHHVTGMGEVLTGDGLPIDETTFLPLAGGPLIGKAVALPAEIPAEHAVTWQLDPVTRKALPRTAVTALGAREAP